MHITSRAPTKAIFIFFLSGRRKYGCRDIICTHQGESIFISSAEGVGWGGVPDLTFQKKMLPGNESMEFKMEK